MQNQDMNLVLSTDAKPRLKWTPDLHQRFVEATNQLGGTHKATPKSLMRVMGIPGLTLYHLKSHLQKYRLGKTQLTENSSDDTNKDQEGVKLDLSNDITGDGTNDLHGARAVQVQLEVQRKLYEQIEVQRHLQLRIEAQGRYLQEVLQKAQETLAAYASSSMGAENARAQLSHLVSMVSSGCQSPSLSELTYARALSLENLGNQIEIKCHGCSTESSLTSSEDMEKLSNIMEDENANMNNQDLGKKRKASAAILEANSSKKQAAQQEKNPIIDLNAQYQDEQNLGNRTIDLNCIGMKQFLGASRGEASKHKFEYKVR